MSLDLLAVSPQLRAMVEESEAFRGARLDGASIFASHDHESLGGFAPQWAAQTFGFGKFDPLILRYLARQIAMAVAEAARALQPVRATVGWARPAAGEPPLSFNRKVIGGPVDPSVRVLALWPEGAAEPVRPFVRLVCFAAHPTMVPAMHRAATAAYPGVMARALERDGSMALFLNGPCGDIAGGMYEDERAWWERRMPTEGFRLARLAEEATAGSRPATSAGGTVLAYAEGEVLLPPRHPWKLPLIGRAIAEQYPDRIRVRAVRVDDVLLVFFPGEMGSDLGAAIRDDLSAAQVGLTGAAAAGGPPPPGQNAWVVTLADDYIGYAFSTSEYLHGGHSQHLTIYGEGLGDLLRARLVEIGRACPR